MSSSGRHKRCDLVDLRLQIRMLLTIDRHGSVRLSELAAHLDISPPSASRMVNRLVDDGLIVRRTPDHDRRIVLLRLSAKGRRVLERIRVARRTEIARILDAMSADDRAALAAFTDAAHRLG